MSTQTRSTRDAGAPAAAVPASGARRPARITVRARLPGVDRLRHTSVEPTPDPEW